MTGDTPPVPRRLRIAMIGQQGIPARHGGVERVCEEVGARLAAAGHEVTVFNSRRGAVNRMRTHRGIRVRWVWSTAGKRTGNLTLSLRSTLHVLFRRYDVVHFHAIGPCIFVPLLRFKRRTVVIATIHGRDDLRAKWGRGAQHLLHRAALISASAPDAVIVVSRALRDDYLTTFGRETTYVPNGVSVPADDALVADGPPGVHAPYVLALGRLVPEKAFDDLVAAFRRLDPDLDAELIVIGGSSHTDDYVERLAKAAAGDERIRMLGAIYGDALEEFFRGAALFVIPSHLEGMPLTLLEAAGRGLPVIASDLEVHRDVLSTAAGGPGRRLFPVGDIDALATQLGAALADLDSEHAAAKTLRDEVISRFSWDETAAATLAVYTDALRRKTGGAGARTAP